MRKVSALLLLITAMLAACGTSGQPAVTQTADSVTAAPSIPAATPTLALVIAAQENATPFVFPPRASRQSICEGAPTTYLIVHERGRVTSDDPQPLNVREAAGVDNERVAQLDTLDIFMVIDGPRCADSYTWYKIRAGSVEGWVAEGDGDQYYIEPFSP